MYSLSTITLIAVFRFSCCYALSLSTFDAMFPKASSRVGELGFDIVWILEKFENIRLESLRD